MVFSTDPGMFTKNVPNTKQLTSATIVKDQSTLFVIRVVLGSALVLMLLLIAIIYQGKQHYRIKHNWPIWVSLCWIEAGTILIVSNTLTWVNIGVLIMIRKFPKDNLKCVWSMVSNLVQLFFLNEWFVFNVIIFNISHVLPNRLWNYSAHGTCSVTILTVLLEDE